MGGCSLAAELGGMEEGGGRFVSGAGEHRIQSHKQSRVSCSTNRASQVTA